MASEVPFPAAGLKDIGVLDGDLPELGTLFHRLNNQLGIILANAELIENKSQSESARARAGQIVTSAVDAIATATDIRSRINDQH